MILSIIVHMANNIPSISDLQKSFNYQVGIESWYRCHTCKQNNLASGTFVVEVRPVSDWHFSHFSNK